MIYFKWLVKSINEKWIVLNISRWMIKTQLKLENYEFFEGTKLEETRIKALVQ